MKKISFPNRDGKALSALLSVPVNDNRAVVIVCHGFTGSKEGQGKAVEMSQFLANNNFATLMFDFAGCGESEGNFEETSLSGHISDLTCAVDLGLQLGFGPVITLGRSFGGATAICQAASDSRVAGVCTWAAPASPADLFLGFTDGDLPDEENALVPMVGSEGMIVIRKAFFTDLSQYNVTRCASLISPRPLLVVQGTADAVVPPEEARLLYDSAGTHRELSLINGADHQFSGHYRKVWNILLDWLNNYSY